MGIWPYWAINAVCGYIIAIHGNCRAIYAYMAYWISCGHMWPFMAHSVGTLARRGSAPPKPYLHRPGFKCGDPICSHLLQYHDIGQRSIFVTDVASVVVPRNGSVACRIYIYVFFGVREKF